MELTKEQAATLTKKHGSMRAAARAAGVTRERFRKLMHGDCEPIKQEVTGAAGGFALAGRHVLAERPSDVWKPRFYGLRRGIGYPIDALADEWVASADTIRAKARRFGALRYVEDPKKPGEYIACAVHPETPKGK